MNADLNDIHAATNNLYQLLAVVYEQVIDLYTGGISDHTKAVADRLAALAIIARDEAERIDSAVGEAIAGGNSEDDQ